MTILLSDSSWWRVVLCAKLLLIALRLLIFGQVRVELIRESDSKPTDGAA